jgi:hypothetical protein
MAINGPVDFSDKPVTNNQRNKVIAWTLGILVALLAIWGIAQIGRNDDGYRGQSTSEIERDNTNSGTRTDDVPPADSH